MILPLPVRGVTSLDPGLFERTVQVLAVKVPAKSVVTYRELFKDDLFSQPRKRNVLPVEGSSEFKLLLLKVEEQSEELNQVSETTRMIIKEKQFEIVKHLVHFNYDYWNFEEILRSILPDNVSVPTSFETIGHIAHLNLREEYTPYKNIIGQVILKKTKHIRTVVNKTDSIDTTFRFFKMEVLAGEPDFIVEMKESGCRFKFDFSKVYWNSRLFGEHDRLVKMFKSSDNICDVMAGVGPFAMPASKKGCVVYANDLNPESYAYLCENIRLNKVKTCLAFNLDGREMISKSVAKLNSNRSPSQAVQIFQHYVMNLPDSAIEFLDAFVGIFRGFDELLDLPEAEHPMVHCHCFSRSEDPQDDILKRISLTMKYEISPDSCKIHHVRSVAPNKDMYCASFRLTKRIVFAQ